jgi:hypothetical protein
MGDSLGAMGWLVVVCAGALGFGLVKFLIVTMQDARARDADRSLPGDEPDDPPR